MHQHLRLVGESFALQLVNKYGTKSNLDLMVALEKKSEQITKVLTLQ